MWRALAMYFAYREDKPEEINTGLAKIVALRKSIIGHLTY
jgi:hypothetical protein